MALKAKVTKNGKLIGGIIIDKKGLKYRTENKELIKVLDRVKKDGVNIMGGEEVNEVIYDYTDKVKVTETVGINELHNEIINVGFDWKVEQA